MIPEMASSTSPLRLSHDSLPRAGANRNPAHPAGRLAAYGFVALIVAAVLLRLLVVVLAGDGVNAPWGGTGDAPSYVLLAHNIAAGRGYGYAGYPTAYRAPAYPLLLAGIIRVFGNRALAVVRGLQFLMGLAIAELCARAGGILWGKRAARATLVIALFFPTLVIMTGEVLTETTATLCSAIFLFLLALFFQRPRWGVLLALAGTVGVATLVRFNMALFGFVVLWAIFRQTDLSRWRATALAVVLPALLISPWLIRNFVAFHGALLLSTESGPAAVMGVLSPQGRALPGDSERLRGALGWLPPADIETNDLSRGRLGQESDLNRAAWKAVLPLWRQQRWDLIPLTLSKLGYFWLSTDQLGWTQSFRPGVRAARAAGVLGYWLLLALAVAGWFRARVWRPEMAWMCLFYAILITVLHVPFNMNTRLRMPFIDPWLTVLAGAAVAGLVFRIPVMQGAGESTTAEAPRQVAYAGVVTGAKLTL
jgi:4-amino-4-deoxy-L-arabinose transferase-like glycosyltransferase